MTSNQENELIYESIQLSRTIREELSCIRGLLAKIAVTLDRIADQVP